MLFLNIYYKTIKSQAIIFDRDGVIIDTESLAVESARRAFKQLGFTLLDEDILHMTGRSSRVYTEYFLKKWDFDPEEFRLIHRKYFYNNLDSAPFFFATIALVKKIYSQGITIGMTTSAGKEGTMFILKKLGIDHMFKVIVTKEDCVNLKPDPEPYLLTAKKLGIEPQLCVAIEDTALGAVSAKAAGMKCIIIPNEFTKNQDFSNADFITKSTADLGIYLKGVSSFCL
jgi:beta-phosphoglucomutase-like phosphatase (HAD superfamily)